MEKIIQRRWTGTQAQQLESIPESLRRAAIHPLLAHIYHARGISEAQDLELQLSQLLPPAQLLNTDKAAVLLADTLAAGKIEHRMDADQRRREP